VLFVNRQQHRLLVNSLIALLMTSILATTLLVHRQEQQQAHQIQQVHEALTQMYDQALYHGALGDEEMGPSGMPITVSPVWFKGGLPLNASIPGRFPWLDIAPPGDLSDQPPDPVINQPHQAGFWYNPNRGIFRARVTPQWSLDDTLLLYNQINMTSLTSLPQSADANRRPLALLPSPSALAVGHAVETIDEVHASTHPHPSRVNSPLTP